MEEPEEKIVYRKLYYTGVAFIKYRGELHRPLTGEKGTDHYRLEHYYDVKIHDIKQVSEEYFASLPEVLILNGAHGKIRGCHGKELYDLDAEIVIITGQGQVAHEQVESGEIHGYFEKVPVAFRMEREETVLVSDETEPISDSVSPVREDVQIISDPPLPGKPIVSTPPPPKVTDGVRTSPASGRGCLGVALGILLVVLLILHFLSVLTSGVGLAFLIWIVIVGTGFLIGWCIDLFRRFPRTGNFIFGIFRWAFSLIFVLFLINGVIHLPDGNKRTSGEGGNNEAVRDTVTIETVNPVPDQPDRTSTTTNDSLRKKIIVRMRWKDLSGQHYSGSYALYTDDIATSDQRLREYRPFWGTEYRDIYGYVSSYDRFHMNGVFSMLDSIRSADTLSGYPFAEVIVTMVQSIGYVLVLDGSCASRQEEPAIVELLRTGVPCIGHAPYGLRTPLQFLSDMKGDCDTRTVLLYNLLKHYGYDVAIINSQYYTHSMLGLNLPGITGSYKMYDGKRYYFWETTDKGFPLGTLPQEAGNTNYWNVELNE